MRTRDRVLTLGLCGAVMLAAAGCKDEASARRSEIEKQIGDLSLEFAQTGGRVTTPGTDEFETQRTDLSGLLGKVNGIRDAEDGQAAALSTLQSAIHRELGRLRLAEIVSLEAQYRHDRAVVAHAINVAQRLHAVAEARYTVEIEGARDDLRALGADAEQERRDQSLELARLDGPITELTQDNNIDQAEVDRVSATAGELRRAAAALGPADGFDKFQEAIELERRVDEFEGRMAYRDIELDLDLKPEHRLAEQRVDHAQRLIQSLSTAEQRLESYLETVTGEARATQTFVDGLNRRLADALDELIKDRAAALDALYDEATGHLEQGTQAASRGAGRGDEADSGRLASARINALLGELHLTRMRSMAGRQVLLEKIAGASDMLPVAPDYADLLQQTKTAVETAGTSARAAYEQAQQSLQQVSSRTARDAANSLSTSLGAAITALGGPAMGMPGGAGAGGTGGAGGAGSGASGGAGSPGDSGMPLTMPSAGDGGGDQDPPSSQPGS